MTSNSWCQSIITVSKKKEGTTLCKYMELYGWWRTGKPGMLQSMGSQGIDLTDWLDSNYNGVIHHTVALRYKCYKDFHSLQINLYIFCNPDQGPLNNMYIHCISLYGVFENNPSTISLLFNAFHGVFWFIFPFTFRVTLCLEVWNQSF